MYIKCCGMTRLVDARSACASGATAVGFIFAAGKRAVAPAEVARISKALQHDYPEVDRVGVFVNAEIQKMVTTLTQCALNVVQLHGRESNATCAAMAAHARVIQVVHIVDDLNLPPRVPEGIWKYLIEPQVAGVAGGSGTSFDWRLLAGCNLDNMIVAGGLNGDMLKHLLAQAHPFGVDACSGIEAQVRLKDPAKVDAFCKAALKQTGKPKRKM